jgi:uncharacterized protein YqhQ
MRAPGMVSTAVRRPDGTIVVRNDPYVSLVERIRLLKLPVLRGAVGLVEMLVIGVRTLNFSAEIALAEQSQPGASGRKNGAAGESRWSLGLTVALGLTLGVGLFFVLPLFVATLLFRVEQDPVLFNGIAGAVRMLLLLAYLGGIAMLKDIQRLFAYHGAEHKAVAAYERGLGTTVEAAQRQSRFHPRCGTSFLLIVMLLAILIFALVDALLLLWLGQLTLPLRLVAHLLLLPAVGGVSYEILKLSARRSGTVLGRMLVAPGLWLQMITTREPTADQIEVALAALRGACALKDEPMLEAAVT